MNRSEKFFSPDYFTARNRFRELTAQTGGRLQILPLGAKGPAGEELSIDIAWFGSAYPRRALLHSSGLHGVEGFAGSAIQLQLLENLPNLSEDAALVVSHVLNPYGMAWLRRVNENNVDLNRNCLPDQTYEGVPPTYAKLDSFLNPNSPPASDFFAVRVAWLILRYGMPALKQAVVGGQYEYPAGLFFGGKCLQQGPERFQTFLAPHLATVDRIVAIDVHTGLGKYGEDTLLAEETDYELLRDVFGERVRPSTPEESPAYRVRGSLSTMIPKIAPKATICAITQEFGTYNSTKVLRALREENRWHHYGAGTLDHPSKRILKETFCPQDETWRESVLTRGDELLKQGLAKL